MSMEMKHPKNSLRTWHRQNRKNILLNLWLRIAFLFLDALLVLGLLSLLTYFLDINRSQSLAGQLLGISFWGFLLILPVLYGWKSCNQILLELSLNSSISSVRREIERILTKERKDFRVLQFRINSARIELKDFIDYSQIVIPPIYGYELQRLQKGIDVFFNATSEVLFSKPNIFSRAQKIEQKEQELQQIIDRYSESGNPTEDDLCEQFEEKQKDEEGIIDTFDFLALDEFLIFLGDTLFARTEKFSPIAFKHPIDLITLSRFFDNWNSVVSSCDNCKSAFEKSRRDIEKYYRLLGRRELHRKQRMSRLMDNVMVVIVSVTLSIIANYLIRLT